jgi:hypothetical protein
VGLDKTGLALAAIAYGGEFPELACGLGAAIGCGYGNVVARLQTSAGATPIDNCETLSSPPVGDAILLRAVLAPVSQQNPAPAMRCRVDYGVAVGEAAIGMDPLMPGRAAVRILGPTLEVTAIATYSFTPGVACPPPDIR